MEKKVKSALRYSTLDGIAYSIMYGFGEYYFAAYALLLNATDFQLGFLTTFPILLASIVQLYSTNLMHKIKSRKKAVVILAALQSLIFIPMLLIYNLDAYRISALTIFISLYAILGWVANPIWTSWIGDLVPKNVRGKFFSKRQIATSSSIFISFVLAGLILTYTKNNFATEYAGFVIIFVLSIFARLVSVFFLSKQYEPKLKIEKQYEFSFKQFLKEFKQRFKTGHFNVMVAYMAIMYFGLYVTSPYVIAYLFNDIHFNYINYVLFVAVSLIVELSFLPVGGRLIDKYSSLPVLKLTGYTMAIIPLLLAFSRTMPMLVLTQIVGGFIWSGFTLASLNFMLETTTPQKRATAISYYNAIIGIFIFVGSLVGAYVIKLALELDLSSISPIFWSRYVIIFFIGAAIRFVVALIFLPKLKQIEVKKRISSKDLLIKVLSSFPHRLIHKRINVHK